MLAPIPLSLPSNQSFFVLFVSLSKELESNGTAEFAIFCYSVLFDRFETDPISLSFCPLDLLRQIKDRLPIGSLRDELRAVITDGLWP